MIEVCVIVGILMYLCKSKKKYKKLNYHDEWFQTSGEYQSFQFNCASATVSHYIDRNMLNQWHLDEGLRMALYDNVLGNRNIDNAKLLRKAGACEPRKTSTTNKIDKETKIKNMQIMIDKKASDYTFMLTWCQNDRNNPLEVIDMLINHGADAYVAFITLFQKSHYSFALQILYRNVKK